jgi:hypothetical protein
MPAMTEAMKRGWLAITDRRKSDERHHRKDDDVQAEDGGIGRQIKRHRQIVRHSHEAGTDHGCGDAAGGDP